MAEVIVSRRGQPRRNPLAAGLDTLAQSLLFTEALQRERNAFDLQKRKDELLLDETEMKLKEAERVQKAREQFRKAHEQSKPTEGTLPQQPMVAMREREQQREGFRLAEMLPNILEAFPEAAPGVLAAMAAGRGQDVKGVPAEIFGNLTPEEQRRLIGVEREPTMGEIMGPQQGAAPGAGGFAAGPVGPAMGQPAQQGMTAQGMGVQPIPLAGTQPSVAPIAPGGTQPSVAPIPQGPPGPAVAQSTGRVGELNQAIATRDAEIDKLEGVMLRLRPSDKVFKAVETRLKMEEAARERLVKVRDRLEARAAPTRTTQEIALAEFDKPFEELNQQQRATVRGIARRESLRERRQAGVDAAKVTSRAKREEEVAAFDLRASDANASINNIVGVFDQRPEAWGTSGAMAATIVGISDQVSNFARLIRPDFSLDPTIHKVFEHVDDFASGIVEEEEFLNRTTEPFEKRLREAGITNRVQMGEMVGLAISLATMKAIEGRGRLTSDMVRLQLDELLGAGGTKSWPAARAGLLRVQEDIFRKVDERRRVLLGGEKPRMERAPAAQAPRATTEDPLGIR